MENIKFIREIMRNSKTENGREIGDAIYYSFDNGNRAKVYVEGGNIYREAHGVKVEIVHKTGGAVDSAYFPFEDYFDPVQCSPNAPKWTPHIVDGKWYFNQYPHCLPKRKDFDRLAASVDEYMGFFK